MAFPLLLGLLTPSLEAMVDPWDRPGVAALGQARLGAQASSGVVSAVPQDPPLPLGQA